MRCILGAFLQTETHSRPESYLNHLHRTCIYPSAIPRSNGLSSICAVCHGRDFQDAISDMLDHIGNQTMLDEVHDGIKSDFPQP